MNNYSHWKIFFSVAASIIIFLIMLIPVMPVSGYADISAFNEAGFLIAAGILLLFLACSFLFYKVPVTISSADILVILYFSYSFINACFKTSYYPALYYKSTILLGLLIVYMAVSRLTAARQFTTKKIIIVFSLLAFVQVLGGLLQMFNTISSNHSTFLITGGFFNSAPYAIYLASVIAFLLPVLIYRIEIKTFNPYILFLAAIVCSGIAIIIVCYSRSAWTGLFCSIVFIIYSLMSDKLSLFFKTLKYRILTITAALVFLIIAGVWLFYLKKDSATGRLLTWTVSTDLIKDHLLTGTGNGNFAVNYMQHQYIYFKQSEDVSPKYTKLAGDVRFAFNDFLELLCEEGIVGGILAIGLLLVISFSLKKQVFSDGFHPQKIVPVSCSAALIVILVSGLFSYPPSLLAFKVYFWALIGIIAGINDRPEWPILQRKLLVKKNTIVVASILTASFYLFYGFNQLAGIKRFYQTDEYTSSSVLLKLSPLLADHTTYLIRLGKSLANEDRNAEAAKVLEQAKKTSPDKEIYYTLGGIYKALKSYDLAEENYLFVATSIPNLLMPEYLLAKLYYESGQQEKWEKMSDEVIHFRPKIESFDTVYMQQEIQNLRNSKK